MRTVLLFAALLSTSTAAIAANGPFAKFDDRPYEGYKSTLFIFDIERCLIDTPGWAPQVYRQPDRPDFVQLLWVSQSDYVGGAKVRVDLEKVDGGTKVKAWPSSTFLTPSQLFKCAPKP